MAIRNATVDDAEAIVQIYNRYILESVVTFEMETIDAAEIARRMKDVASRKLPWIVYETTNQATGDLEIAGYAYGGVFRDRSAFRNTVETTVYLDQAHTGKGLGFKLYNYLIQDLRQRGLRTVIGGIALPNEASVRLHEKCGFTKVAHFPEVGYKFDRWIDVGFWQMMLRDVPSNDPSI